MKTGILGGTFDPIHSAHLMIAQKAYTEFGLDKVLFMPSPNPPHKNESEITPLKHRIRMIELAIADFDYFHFSDFELNREGKVYSAETLTRYKKLYPHEELYFIVGSDSLFSIDSWYHPEIIFEKANILAAKRDDKSLDTLTDKIKYLKKQYKASISEIEVEASSISSTKIRVAANKLDLADYIPQKVCKYIIENHLYEDYKGLTRMTNTDIIDELKNSQNSDRFKHTLAVAKTAQKMSEALGENPNKAYLAGLLHDCAKCISDEELVIICKENGIDITASEKNNLYLLHAKVGAYLSEHKYGITDKDILHAVRYHTTGRPNMSLLEKIIFTADYIEPGRYKQKNLDILRNTAYEDIDYTVYLILKDTVDYLKSKKSVFFDKNTIKALDYYKNLIKNR